MAVTARIVAALIALRRSVLRRRKIASALGRALTAATTAPAPATASETAASTITSAITASITTAAIALRATEALAAAIVARATIVALRILLRRVVVRSEILWRRCVRFRLALLEFVVRFEIAVRVTRLGAQLVAGLDDVADVVVLMVVAMFVVVMFFAVRLGTSIGVSFVVFLPIMLLVGMFFVLVGFGTLALVALTNRFARQSFGTRGRGLLRRRRAVGITLPMAVIVVFEIFENVADVQEGIAVEADIDEGALHTGEDASDAAFVDAADQRELFFALDINFD